jgi:hypothetical protein
MLPLLLNLQVVSFNIADRQQLIAAAFRIEVVDRYRPIAGLRLTFEPDNRSSTNVFVNELRENT